MATPSPVPLGGEVPAPRHGGDYALAGIISALAMCALVLFVDAGLGILLGPAVIWLGYKGIRESDGGPAVVPAVFAIILGVLGTVVSLVWFMLVDALGGL